MRALIATALVAICAVQGALIHQISTENDRLAKETADAKRERGDFELGMNWNAELVNRCHRRSFTDSKGYGF
jgi:hypothetical protein